jgi:hypothetical protein
MSIAEEVDGQRLSRLLERVAELQDDKAKMEAEVKIISGKLKDAESLAVEALAASGLDGCRAAGKSWFMREFFSVSIPAEHKERVVEIAEAECPELVSVNTASLKAWLVEERRGQEVTGESLAAGTPFDGLVSEYREMRLSHRAIG